MHTARRSRAGWCAWLVGIVQLSRTRPMTKPPNSGRSSGTFRKHCTRRLVSEDLRRSVRRASAAPSRPRARDPSFGRLATRAARACMFAVLGVDEDQCVAESRRNEIAIELRRHLNSPD